MPSTTLRLRALSGTPLDNRMIRDTVIAAAKGLAERSGIELAAVTADDRVLTIELGLDRIAAIGFVSELRRSTNAWYENKFHDGPLWGTPPPGADPASDAQDL